MLCVHLGPGRLGLGLIVEQLGQSQLPVCLVGRPGAGAEPMEYGLSFTDPEIGLEYRTVDWYSDARTAAELPEQVLDRIDSPAPLLITSALGARITERVALIAEIVDRRRFGSETVLIACENEPHDDYLDLAEKCAGRLVLCRSVVDRICSWPITITIDENGETIASEHPRDGESRRVTVVHPVGEWVIAAPEPKPAILAALEPAPLVRVIHGDIAPYEDRKLWLVNGVHTVLALLARLERIRQLPLHEPYRQAFLETATPLMAQIAAALDDRHPDFPRDNDYMRDRIRAFTQTPDTTARILERTLKRSDLRPFMARLNKRVGNAARASRKAGEDCEPFYQVMTLVVGVLSDRQLYYRESEPAPIDEDIDQDVLVMFAATLSEWLDEPRAQDLSALLERALTAHRAL
jgi:hypothetical protein